MRTGTSSACALAQNASSATSPRLVPSTLAATIAPMAPAATARSSSAAAASAPGIGTEAVPRLAGRWREAIGEDVRPGADDLVVDAFLGEPGLACRGGLDEARKERP